MKRNARVLALMGKDWRQEKGTTTEDEMVGWHYWLDGCESEQALGGLNWTELGTEWSLVLLRGTGASAALSTGVTQRCTFSQESLPAVSGAGGEGELTAGVHRRRGVCSRCWPLWGVGDGEKNSWSTWKCSTLYTSFLKFRVLGRAGLIQSLNVSYSLNSSDLV